MAKENAMKVVAVLIVLLLIGFIYLLPQVALIIVAAALCLYLLHPAVDSLERKGIPRGVGAGVIMLLLIGVLLFTIYRIIPIALNEWGELQAALPTMFNQYNDISSYLHAQVERLPLTIHQEIDQHMYEQEQRLAERVVASGAALLRVGDLLIALFVLTFLLFFGLRDYPMLLKTIWYITPTKSRDHLKPLAHKLHLTIGGYLRGIAIVAIAITAICFVAFTWIGLPYASLLAILVGATNIIPFFGPILGAIPVLILAFTEGKIVVVAIFLLALQLVEGNVLSPLIVGASLHMHPLLIIFSLLVGHKLLGIIGLIVAVPTVAIMKVILIEVKEWRIARNGIYD
ncbi:AI-2E family transporter [Paenalkalicoccus suaedae]|uniref:AI-2E family transporter n=1 Tax=Paenalkalicoccus suaedae TaxID=2592382 RepID=A0A859FEY1_9BACI|nr:AI-2E family transporter [Paenalkalicoccus suaedae]QKS70796.1 AI-2E family transporter [Paenalkalicoccus suaedae]